MKAGKIIVILILGICLGVLGSVGVYFMTVNDIPWQVYLEEQLIPNAVLAMSAVSALCVAALPIISKIQLAVLRFNKATDDVNETVIKGHNTAQALIEQDEKIAAFSKRFDEMESLFCEGVKELKGMTGQTNEIVRIGFCNTDEIVRKGYAAEIAKVGAKDEQTEKET